MKLTQNKAFTLVELLVVITILAIISVVAYQNFGGAVNKALSGRKINDISTIETSLQQYYVDNNYYPPTDIYDATTNLWGYSSTIEAKPSNMITVTYDGQEIDTIASSAGGGKVYGTGAWALTNAATKKQIGAKGTISRATLGKKYLSKDLYDPEIGDLKVKSTGETLIDSGIGRYVYSTYKKNKGEGGSGEWSSNFNGKAYNLAVTIRETGTDTYITKIVGDYDEESCYDDSITCLNTLIGSSGSNGILVDGSQESGESDVNNYGVPYAVTDFSE